MKIIPVKCDYETILKTLESIKIPPFNIYYQGDKT